MIGDDVENLPHPVFMQRRYKTVVIFGRANLRVQAQMVNNVIAVHASRPRTQIRRCITMRDSKRRKIRHYLCRLFKCEVAVELQAICRKGYTDHSFRIQMAVFAGTRFEIERSSGCDRSTRPEFQGNSVSISSSERFAITTRLSPLNKGQRTANAPFVNT